ncbi:MAG TPA: NAD+ synthase [Patescibacteria group bacterium]|nr:NAD+ synthase [Patescibacteria group bacterium]
MQQVRIGLAQINCTVGDLKGNTEKINTYVRRAESAGIDILAFPELALVGYPPEDLLLKPKFVEDNLLAMAEVARFVDHMVVIVGFVDRKRGSLYNAAAVLYGGKVKGLYYKMLLPNYGVFDEKRYFEAGRQALTFKAAGVIFGVNICEDIWHQDGPLGSQAKAGAKLIININSSPYHAGKIKEREAVVQKQANLHGVWIAYVNAIGGQDELVFDGQSMIVASSGKVVNRAEAFKEDLLITDIKLPVSKAKSVRRVVEVVGDLPYKNKIWAAPRHTNQLDPVSEVYQALVLGLHDYVVKNGFQKVVVGLSGGIDSSLVATLAADALGKDNVVGIFMPSRYSSKESEADSSLLAHNLGIRFLAVSIEQIYRLYLMVLEPHFESAPKNITEENLQARIRGNFLMAFSNKFGWLVLTTGNKSEMSTGYATLYGDMAGGFAVIKDVPKTMVYKLAHYRNTLTSVIPESVLRKAPTAELKPHQKDSDTLPPYEVLDPILKAYVEEDRRLKEVVALGFQPETVERVFELVDRSEYKRRQSPPGIKITPKSFGKDRRMPITNKYRG